ncbi:MAG: type IV pilus secretin PilQ, partial [Gammaproteobacteria bacterium]|nr:type IV pilus secretin PilQ [Gammaproteobacteria bacterium]
ASVPENLQKRLDVIDFATPVQTIDTFDKGGNARVVIRAAGRYSHMAYQAGDVFTLSIKPLSAEETAEEDELGYKGEKLSLNFQNIEVRAALQVIADFTGINFVTSDAVKGNLTLRLRDVPWDQALDIILRTRGLAKREQGNVIWVAPVEEIAAKEKLELEASKTVLDLEPLVSELIPINYAKASDIAALLKSIKAVSPGVQTRAFSSVSIAQTELDTNTLLSPRGNVTVDERTNSLLIQDTASKIREVKKLITRLDTPVKQVLIETRIVEANDDFSRNLGARLGAQNYNPSVNIPGSPTTNAGEGIISGDIENNITFLDEIAPTIDPVTGVVTPGEFTISNTPIVDLPSPGIGGVPAASLAFTLLKIAAGGAGHLLNLEISALESEGRGKIIANPRLVTANQKQARIEQGQERIFPPSGFSDQPTTVEAKLSLTVTPQVTPEDSIILDVVITQDTFVSATDPTINTKSVNTQVLLNNGETVVIGGIYQEEERENVTKVPILGDMPLIGNAFRNKGTLRNKTELLIFLTPRVISPALDLAGG